MSVFCGLPGQNSVGKIYIMCTVCEKLNIADPYGNKSAMLFSYIYHAVYYLCSSWKKKKDKKKPSFMWSYVFGFCVLFCHSFIINVSQMAMVLPEFIIGFFLDNQCCKSHMFTHNFVLQD